MERDTLYSSSGITIISDHLKAPFFIEKTDGTYDRLKRVTTVTFRCTEKNLIFAYLDWLEKTWEHLKIAASSRFIIFTSN